mmetsp:Transcript_29407/g.94376  ORF Transcript_29407/g.94376 Transcript_29407/m.94376 type:complete len:210 (+) Transcript_29407:731-1360(+)
MLFAHHSSSHSLQAGDPSALVHRLHDLAVVKVRYRVAHVQVLLQRRIWKNADDRGRALETGVEGEEQPWEEHLHDKAKHCQDCIVPWAGSINLQSLVRSLMLKIRIELNKSSGNDEIQKDAAVLHSHSFRPCTNRMPSLMHDEAHQNRWEDVGDVGQGEVHSRNERRDGVPLTRQRPVIEGFPWDVRVTARSEANDPDVDDKVEQEQDE